MRSHSGITTQFPRCRRFVARHGLAACGGVLLALTALISTPFGAPASAATSSDSVLKPFGLIAPAFSGSDLLCVPIHRAPDNRIEFLVRSARLQLDGDSGLSVGRGSPLVILRTDRAGAWTRTWSSDVTNTPGAVSAVDIDQDGREDVLCATADDEGWSTLTWYRQLATGEFAPPIRGTLGAIGAIGWIGVLAPSGRILVWSDEPGYDGVLVPFSDAQFGPGQPIGPPPEFDSMDFTPFASVPADSSAVILATTDRGRQRLVFALLGPSGWELAGAFPRSFAAEEEFACVRRQGLDEVWYWPAAHPDTIVRISAMAEGVDGLTLYPVPVEGLDPDSSPTRTPSSSPIVTVGDPLLLARAVSPGGGVIAATLIEIDAEGGAHLRREWPVCPSNGLESGPVAILAPASKGEPGPGDGSAAEILWQIDGAAFVLARQAPPAPPPDLTFSVSLWSNIGDRSHDGVQSPLVDLDGDGRVDLLYQDEHWKYQMRPGTGEPPWFGPARPIDGVPESTMLFAAEFDGAPGTELLAQKSGSDAYFAPLFWNGTGYRAGMTVSTSWAVPAVGDFDGDGRDEVFDPESASFVQWTPDGAAEPSVPAPGVVSRVFGAADFDGDGRDELIANPSNLLAWQTADPATGHCGPLAYAVARSWLWGRTLQCVPDRPVEICSQRIFETVQLIHAGRTSTERHGRDRSVDRRSWPGPPSTKWGIDEAADLQADGERELVMHWYAEPGWVAVLREPWGDAHYEIGLLPEVLAGVRLHQEAGLHWTDLDEDGAEDLVILRLDGIRTVMNPIFHRMTGREWRAGPGPEVRLLSANPGRLPLSLALRLHRPGDVVVSLFDSGGRRVYSRIHPVTTDAWCQIAVDPRPEISVRGMYWLQVHGDEGRTSRKIIVIDHGATQ